MSPCYALFICVSSHCITCTLIVHSLSAMPSPPHYIVHVIVSFHIFVKLYCHMWRKMKDFVTSPSLTWPTATCSAISFVSLPVVPPVLTSSTPHHQFILTTFESDAYQMWQNWPRLCEFILTPASRRGYLQKLRISWMNFPGLGLDSQAFLLLLLTLQKQFRRFQLKFSPLSLKKPTITWTWMWESQYAYCLLGNLRVSTI